MATTTFLHPMLFSHSVKRGCTLIEELSGAPNKPDWIAFSRDAAAQLEATSKVPGVENAAKLCFHLGQYLSKATEQLLTRARVISRVAEKLPQKGHRLLAVELSHFDYLDSVHCVVNCFADMLTIALMDSRAEVASKARFWFGLSCGAGGGVQEEMHLGSPDHSLPRATAQLRVLRARFEAAFGQAKMMHICRTLNCDFSTLSVVMVLMTVDARRRRSECDTEVLRNAISKGDFLQDLVRTSVAMKARKQVGWRMRILRWCWTALFAMARELRCTVDLPSNVLDGIRERMHLPAPGTCRSCRGAAPPVGPVDESCYPLCSGCGRLEDDATSYIAANAFGLTNPRQTPQTYLAH
jgi:hypothetical protein